MGRASLKGGLLVATPALQEPVFDRTVVLLLEHGEEGALGLVLNRPSTVGLADTVPEWEDFAAPPPVVFSGGPVAPGTAICLARSASETDTESWTRVSGGLGALNIARGPDEVDPPVDQVRVFSGHAGWAPEQLEGEIAAGAWFAIDAEPDDALTPHPLELWSGVLRRQRPKLAVFASFPPDPLLN